MWLQWWGSKALQALEAFRTGLSAIKITLRYSLPFASLVEDERGEELGLEPCSLWDLPQGCDESSVPPWRCASVGVIGAQPRRSAYSVALTMAWSLS